VDRLLPWRAVASAESAEDDAKTNRRRHKIYSDIAVEQLACEGVKIYRGFPARLHHRVPHRVEPGALFHIRIALDRQKEQKA
jgi:hypothetical protein